MLKIINRLFVLLIAVELSVSCNLENLKRDTLVGAGVSCKDTVGFSLSCVYAGYATKSPIQVDETLIKEMNVYVVNEQGDVIDYKYITGYDSAIKLFVYKQAKHKVYVMANVGKVNTLKNAAEIESYRFSIGSLNEISAQEGGLPMSGSSEMRNFNGGEDLKVMLRRAISQFVVKCDYSRLNKGVSIKVKRIMLMNAPTSVLLFSPSRASKGNVIAGEERVTAELSHLNSEGEGFWLLENLQGRVAPGAVDNKSKISIMGEDVKSAASYIQMDYDYISPEKRGSISYKFYLGSSYEDCDVTRNTRYTCTVFFKGNGSAEENSESVDNSGLLDRVTGLEIIPSSYLFDTVGDVFAPSVKITPLSAFNKGLVWSSSNQLVVSVDKYGSMKAVSEGDCVITARSVENPDIFATCNVSVVQPDLAFVDKNKKMFDGEETLLLWKKLIPNNMIPNVISSDKNVLEIIEVNSMGVRVKAKMVGNVAVTASKAKAVDICNIKVEELKINFNAPFPFFMYCGFDDPVSYSVLPLHAALLHSAGKLNIKWSSSDDNLIKHISSNIFRGVKENSKAQITASFVDYPLKKFSITASVKPAITIKEENVNIAAHTNVLKITENTDADIHVSYQMNIDKHPRAIVSWSGANIGWLKDNIHVSPAGNISIDNETASNGVYSLVGTIANADDGKEYYDTTTISIYDAVKVWMINTETNTGFVEGDGQSINVESSFTGHTDNGNKIGLFKGILVPNVNKTIIIEAKDAFSYYYDYSFIERVNYPCKVREVVYISVLSPLDPGGGSDKRYRFYYSAPSL